MKQPRHPRIVVTGASAGGPPRDGVRFCQRGRAPWSDRAQTRRSRRRKPDVEARGGKAFILPADVAEASTVEAAAERVERELDPIDPGCGSFSLSVCHQRSFSSSLFHGFSRNEDDS